MSKSTSVWKKVLLIGVLCLICIWAWHWCSEREGYYEDEVWSFMLANSYYNPSLKDDPNYLDTWNSGRYYRDAITVQKDERFDLASVNYNQTQDTHPPLFYDVIYVLESLKPDTFNPDLIYMANIFFLIVTALFCYRIAWKITRDFYISAFVMSLFGFSSVAVSSAMFLRMYALLTMFVVISAYLHVCMLENQEDDKNWVMLLGIAGIVEWLGGMTQYYFWVIQAFMSFGVVFVNLKEKKIRKTLEYVSMEISCLVMYFICWPNIVNHTLSGGLNNPMNNVTGLSGAIEKVRIFTEYLNPLFGGRVGIIAVLLLAIVLFVIDFKGRKNFDDNASSTGISYSFYLLAVAVAYLLLLSQIVPSFAVNWPEETIALRYFMPVYPFIMIFIGIGLGYGVRNLIKKYDALVLVLLLAAFIANQFSYHSTVDTLLYRGSNEITSEVNAEKTKAIYVTSGGYQYAAILNYLAMHEGVINVLPNDFWTALQSCMAGDKLDEDLMIYVEWNGEFEQNMLKTLDSMGIQYKDVNPSKSLRLHHVYKIYKQ